MIVVVGMNVETVGAALVCLLDTFLRRFHLYHARPGILRVSPLHGEGVARLDAAADVDGGST